MAWALFLATINRIFQLVDPQIFRLLVDNYANKISEFKSQEFITGVGLLLLVSVGAAFISRVAKNFQDYYVNVITQRVGTRLYAQAITHSFSLPYAAFEDQRSGELLQKLQKARADSQIFIAGLINTVFFSLVGIVLVLGYAFCVHWAIGLVYFLIIPTLAAVTFLISRRIKKAQEHIVKQSADLAGSTTETLRNVQLVKSLGLENQEIQRLNTVNDEILKLELYKVKLVRKMLFTQGTLINALRSLLLFLMLWLIFQQQISLGEFFSLLFYSFFIFTPLSDLGQVISSYQEARASMEQVEEVLRLPAEQKPMHPQRLDGITTITFKNVGFRYARARQQSVRDVNFVVHEGETIAFAGLSGAGKTTLLKLLTGLYPPTEGAVLFNDIDSRRIDFESLRKRIGLVSQETQLFAGTIRENLLFVKPEAGDEECLRVLRSAAANQILTRAEKGLDTKIGEGGLKLSGGERQRLAIARALLREPDLLIFDEATSNLDSLTEREITRTMKTVSERQKNMITILVAHRLSTIMHADKIYVLEKGGIVESGSHANLLTKQGLYAALWRQQSGEEFGNV
jgi:ATP-binding cassette subfamily B protein